MLRKIGKQARKGANKCCPKPTHVLGTTDEKGEHEVIEMERRLKGFAICYNMIWSTLQLSAFIILLILFLFSKDNIFMKEHDCCTSTEYLKNSETGGELPLSNCPIQSCKLYDHTFTSSKKLIQDRPREAHDGDYSFMFQYNQQQWCCNMAESDDQCCNKMPYGVACGALMWAVGFSAVCAMFMVQILLQAIYAFTSRRASFWVVISAILGVILRVILFAIVFYFFFGFMFGFMFFWVPMIYCDNRHGFNWWKFGAWYVWYFFDNAEWLWSEGVTKWDQNMDIDSMIAAHTAVSLLLDLVFSFLYLGLNLVKDKKKRPYFHLAFFKL